ncbi:MAG: amino acid adenylation domain-containing protein [Arcicella sp.]|nr:amino acid adenylation domain-containing protein [Arcicella sp.]
MKKVLRLFTQLKQEGIRIKVVNNQLVVECEGELKPEIKEDLLKNKQEIIEFFNENTSTIAQNEGIDTAPVKEYYQLSDAQKRLWILEQLGMVENAYHIVGAFYLSGSIDKNVLNEACLKLIERHESLRTRFISVDDTPMQQVLPMSDVIFNVNYQSVNTNNEDDIAELIEKENSVLFDLKKGVLFRVNVIEINSQERILVYVIHHIISDGWSGTILTNEITVIYNSLLKNQKIALEPLKIQYKDYSEWQKNKLSSVWADDAKKYWNNTLAGAIPLLELTTDAPRPTLKSYYGGTVSNFLEKSTLEKVQKINNAQGTSMFIFFLGVVNLLLSKYSGQDEIIIGVPTSGRDSRELRNQIGYFVNVLPLKNKIDSSALFAEYLSKVKELILEAFNYQDYPINLIIDSLDLAWDSSRSPLFDVIFDYHNFSENEIIALGDSTLKPFSFNPKRSKYDLEFIFTETQNGLIMNLNYNSDLFSIQSAERFLRHYKNLVESILENPTFNLSSLPYLSCDERTNLLFDFQPPRHHKNSDKTLLDLFQEQVIKTPNAIAIVCGDETLTYQQLNERANGLANKILQDYSIQKGAMIGLLTQRNEYALISILGIMKAGGCYIPIDMDYPDERIKYILADAKVNLVITEMDYFLKIGEVYSGDIFVIDIQDLCDETEFSFVPVSAQDLAYTIYTSGSTGYPKGVSVGHSSIVNYVQWANAHYFNNNSGFHTALFTSLSFDLTLTTIFTTLLRGDTIIIYPSNETSIILKEVFSKNSGINFLKVTPSHIGLIPYLDLVETCIERIVIGGEVLKPEHIASLQKLNPNIIIYNEYGPTETTVGCVVDKIVNKDDIITIGKPIDNTQIYILDSKQQLLPIGVAGEIYIGGSGLAKGYLNNQELTDIRFIMNPFCEGERLYKTGDLAKWLPDGRIDYLGRIDNQVKIRGFRIELGEIENTLKKNALIRQAVVVAHEDKKNDKYLVAYIEGGELLNANDWKKYLREYLPEYMIPTYFVTVDEWILTPNGKLNINALPSPFVEEKINCIAYSEPNNEVEFIISKIIKDALIERNITQIGMNENFFDQGIDSLKVVKVFKSINDEYPEVVKIHEIFSYPTIQKLADLIIERNSQAINNPPVVEIIEF